MQRQALLLVIGTCLALLGRASAQQNLGHEQQRDINRVGDDDRDQFITLASHTATSRRTQLTWLAVAAAERRCTYTTGHPPASCPSTNNLPSASLRYALCMCIQ
jgi:hypothetical protein